MSVAHYAFVNGKPDSTYPKPADLANDQPPVTIVTHVARKDGKAVIRGTTASADELKSVMVNGKPARLVNAKAGEWEVELTDLPAGTWKVEANAEDTSGNVEKRAHARVVP